MKYSLLFFLMIFIVQHITANSNTGKSNVGLTENNHQVKKLDSTVLRDDPDGDNIPIDSDEEEDTDKDRGEMMDTAENIVFRPYFKYKKQRIQKKRIRNPVHPTNVAHEKVDQGPKNEPPPVLIYDKHAGQYYAPDHYPAHKRYYHHQDTYRPYFY